MLVFMVFILGKLQFQVSLGLKYSIFRLFRFSLFLIIIIHTISQSQWQSKWATLKKSYRRLHAITVEQSTHSTDKNDSHFHKSVEMLMQRLMKTADSLWFFPIFGHDLTIIWSLLKATAKCNLPPRNTETNKCLQEWMFAYWIVSMLLLLLLYFCFWFHLPIAIDLYHHLWSKHSAYICLLLYCWDYLHLKIGTQRQTDKQRMKTHTSDL